MMKILLSLVLLSTIACAREGYNPKNHQGANDAEIPHGRQLNNGDTMCSGKSNCYEMYDDPDTTQLVKMIYWTYVPFGEEPAMDWAS